MTTTPTTDDEPGTELAVYESRFPAIASDFDIRDIIEENLNGEMREEYLTLIKLPTAGGSRFEIPDVFGGDEVVAEIDGVILGQYHRRAWWPDELGAKGTTSGPPLCSASDPKQSKLVGSVDLVRLNEREDSAKFASPDARPGGECATCPMGQFGSHPSGDNRQWCRSAMVLMFLRPGEILPSIVRIPGTSSKNFMQYATQLSVRRTKLTDVVTRIGLEQAMSAANVKYAKATFTVAEGERLPDEVAEQMRAYRTSAGFSRAEQIILEDEGLMADIDGTDIADAEVVSP